jgi:prevent-host-death family protein
MRTITATELRQKLGEVLDAAATGERVLIERDHRPLAYLVSFEDGQGLFPRDDERIQRQLDALDALVAMGTAWRLEHPASSGDSRAAEWIRADRDHHDDEKFERSFGHQVPGGTPTPDG